MINPVLTNNNLNYNYAKPVFKASEQNKQDNDSSVITKNIKECSLGGFWIGMISSFIVDGTGDSYKLALKKIGLGIILGTVTGLITGIAIDTSNKYIYKDEKKRNYYYKLSKGIFNTGMGAIVGSTLMTFTAGNFVVDNWFKGKKTELWGGIAGGLAGVLLSIMSSNKNNNKPKLAQKPVNIQV